MGAQYMTSVLCLAALLGAASPSGATVAFSGPTYYYDTANPYAMGVVSGDFNSDGIPDLVSVNRNNYPYDTAHQFFYFQGVGDGRFLAPIATSFESLTTDLPGGVTAADVDHDGNLDVIINYVFDATLTSFPSTTFTVYLGDGTGHFDGGRAIGSGTGAGAVAAADFDGDGNADLADSGARIYLGNGDGTFQTPLLVDDAPGGETDSMVLGDVNGDGRIDIGYAYGYGVTILLNAGQGHFTVRSFEYGLPPEQVALADLDGDDKLDIVLSSAPSSLGTLNGTVTVFIGDGQGLFTERQTFVSGPGLRLGHGVVLADFDTDGNLDLATEGNVGLGLGGIIVLRGDGTGSFASPMTAENTFFVAAPNRYMFIDDFDQDGRPDIGDLNGSVGILLNRSSRGCVDRLQLDYTNGTLNIRFSLKSTTPMTWSTWLAFQSSIIPLWSVPIPPVPTLVTFTLPFAGFPAIGPIAVLTAMSTGTSGWTCGDFKTVETGGPGPAQSALAQAGTSRLRPE